jgi:hypothetical protein
VGIEKIRRQVEKVEEVEKVAMQAGRGDTVMTASGPGDRLVAALAELISLTQDLPADDAPDRLDDTTLEVFWREWPQVRRWGEILSQRLAADLARPAEPVRDHALDETGVGD